MYTYYIADFASNITLHTAQGGSSSRHESVLREAVEKGKLGSGRYIVARPSERVLNAKVYDVTVETVPPRATTYKIMVKNPGEATFSLYTSHKVPVEASEGGGDVLKYVQLALSMHPNREVLIQPADSEPQPPRVSVKRVSR